MELKSRIDSELLPYVGKPTCYLGNEYNAVVKKLEAIELRVALCFTESYELGIRNILFEMPYYCLNIRPEIWAERIYAPWADAEALMRRQRLPLFSLESKTALKDFHLLGVYFQHALSYTNFLNMLDLAGISFRSCTRNENDPLIIASGPAMSNPEPVADFLDVVIVGEAEDAYGEIADICLRARREEWSRKRLLEELAVLSGVYIPSFYQPIYNRYNEFQGLEKQNAKASEYIQGRVNRQDDSKRITLSPLLPLAESGYVRCAFGETGSVFWAGKEHRRRAYWRQVVIQSFVEMLRKILYKSGDEDWQQLITINENYLENNWMGIKQKMVVDNSSVYFSGAGSEFELEPLKFTNIAELLKKNEFGFSPYTGSSRLRNVVNLDIRNDDLLGALKCVLTQGGERIRLNFMIGIPGEKAADLEASVNIIEQCADIVREYPEAELIVSVQGFSPKAHTSLQWEKQDSPEVLDKKFALLQERLEDVEAKFEFWSADIVSLITLLSRGGRRLADSIKKAWEYGARFDCLKQGFNAEYWKNAFDDTGVNRESRLNALSIMMALPWDHINVGISKSQLKEDKLMAYQGKISPELKEQVSVGSGLPRRDFERILRKYALQTPAINEIQPVSGYGGIVPEEIRYGRRGRKRQTPATVIKRKIRIRYSKTGSARFLSHLDVVRVFERSAKMARIPLVYSQGLRQTPKISYGPPLVTGITSIAEYLDMEVEIGLEADLQNQLNCVLPDGLQILQFKGIYAKTAALAAVVNRITYEVLTSNWEFEEEWINALMAQTEVVVQRITKSGVKELNIRPFMNQLELAANKLLITIDILEGRTAKITEVLEALLIPQKIDYRQFLIQRTGQYIVKENSVYTPFDIL